MDRRGASSVRRNFEGGMQINDCGETRGRSAPRSDLSSFDIDYAERGGEVKEGVKVRTAPNH